MSEKTKKKSWKKFVLTLLFILLNIVVFLATGIAEFSKSKDATEFSEISINWWLLIPAVLSFIVALTIDIHKYALMIRRMSKDKVNNRNIRKVATRTVLLGRYYDNITPAAIGGQPFQMYYMRKNSGLPVGASTSIPIFGMISIQITFIIIALICFLFGHLFDTNPALFLTALFGLLFYAFWPIMVAGVTYFPKPTKKLINAIVKLLSKLKLIKNKDKILNKVDSEADEYVGAVKTILKTRGLFLQVIAWSLIYNLLIAMIPFFVLTAFGGSVDFFSCFVTTIGVMSAIYFIPTPGNSGAAEGTFFLVFSALSSGYVFWAMLIWRFFSYYFYVLAGPVIYFFIHLEKRKEL